MNIQDHLTQDQSTLKRKYNEDQSTQDQSTQDKTPIKRKCEYLDVNIHKNMSEKRNGNFIIHDKVCTCCKRITNKISEYTSTVTRESYKIDDNYTCKSSNCIYLVTCGICDKQYVGKTTRRMRKRHTHHRYEIKANIGGLGTHFFKHAEEMKINIDTNMEEIMQHFKLFIITSANKCSIEEWEDMEAIMMQTLKTTQDHGGMNIRLERRDDQKLYKCDQCDFRANGRDHIYDHKRRNHTDYKVLCEHCGYMTNAISHLHRHVRAKHPEDSTAKHIHM